MSWLSGGLLEPVDERGELAALVLRSLSDAGR
jgi:hypothetical protein